MIILNIIANYLSNDLFLYNYSLPSPQHCAAQHSVAQHSVGRQVKPEYPLQLHFADFRPVALFISATYLDRQRFRPVFAEKEY